MIEIKDPDGTKHKFVVKRATGEGFNCLIDTLRQTLQAPEDIPLYAGYLNMVRGDLVRAYRCGDTRVRSNTYLEFPSHVAATIRSLVRHAREGVPRNRSGPEWQPKNFKIVCVDLDSIMKTTVFGIGSQVRYIAR